MFNKKNDFRKKNGNMTQEEVQEYHDIVELCGEEAYWKDQLDGAIISAIGLMGLCGYILVATCPKIVMILGIPIAGFIVRELTRLRVIEIPVSEIEADM